MKEKKTPWNPSRRATARVKKSLSRPTIGRYDAGLLETAVAGIATRHEYPDDLTPALLDVLGRPNLWCVPYAALLRANGAEIPKHAEAEQAHVLHWLVKLVLTHGDSWLSAADAEVQAMHAKVDALENRASAPKGIVAEGIRAWEADDGRVIADTQKQQAVRDGGASASSVRPFSIPLGRLDAAPNLAAESVSAGLFVRRSMFGPWIEVAHPEPGAVRLYLAPQPHSLVSASKSRAEVTDDWIRVDVQSPTEAGIDPDDDVIAWNDDPGFSTIIGASFVSPSFPEYTHWMRKPRAPVGIARAGDAV